MLRAYIDEIGETGAFVSRAHPRFNTSPAFGYAGGIIPEHNARPFGAQFAADKATVFAAELAAAEHAGGGRRRALTSSAPTRCSGSRIRSECSTGSSRTRGASAAACSNTPMRSSLGPRSRSERTQHTGKTSAMQETLNRIARYADSHDSNVMVIIDQIKEKTRAERLPRMYSHIYARAANFPEMRRIVEPPMHVDSKLSSNIQFADWLAACVTRAIDYQLLDDSPYRWVTDGSVLGALHGAFSRESKLHLW